MTRKVLLTIEGKFDVMQYYSNKEARLSVEEGIGIVRFLKNPSGDDMSFEAVCVFVPLSDKVVKINAMIGKMTRARLNLLCEVLLVKGWSVIYAYRLQWRVLPLGEMMEDGDFAGWWRIDLKKGEAQNAE